MAIIGGMNATDVTISGIVEMNPQRIAITKNASHHIGTRREHGAKNLLDWLLLCSDLSDYFFRQFHV